MASVSALPPRGRHDFEVAVLCALALEAECVHYVFDKVWDDKVYGRVPGDDNAYTLGVIAGHNIVLVHLPSMGTDRAASAATSLRASFTNVKLALVVGICGGMPRGSTGEDIVLGDVVISEALVRYDFGRQYPQGFERKTSVHDILGPPSEKILALLAKLRTGQCRQVMESNTSAFLQTIQEKAPETAYPGIENDVLYRSFHTHRHRSPLRCNHCETDTEICDEAVRTACEDLGCGSVMRESRLRANGSSTRQPKIHLGIMGSGNAVIKSGHHRDALASQEGIIAVEMEGAGVWRHGPTLVIKSVCDYADSHKRKGWQQYAAAAAAACAKAFLTEWSPERQHNSPGDLPRKNDYFLVPPRRVKKFFGREEELARIASYFNDEADQPRMLVLHAMGGQGKSQIALKYCHNSRQNYKGVFWVNGSSTFATTQSLASIAQSLDRVNADRLNIDEAKANLALRTLEQWEDRWLMVFDNCDDATTFPKLQGEYIPQDLLLTSRHRGLEELCDLIEVPPMPRDTGIDLLLHRHRGPVTEDHLSEAFKIVNRLGGLALAIDQASAYIHYTRLPLGSLSVFLSNYLTQRKRILQHVTENFWKYTTMDDLDKRETAVGAFATWEMSFQQLLQHERNQDSVAHFLTLSAFLGLTHVSESLFRAHREASDVPLDWMTIFTTPSVEAITAGCNLTDSGSANATPDDLVPDLSQAVENIDLQKRQESWSSDQFWELLYQTFQVSLLQSIVPAKEPEGASFLLHPLIRDWLQLRLGSNERQAYSREAIEVISSSLKSDTIKKSDAYIRSPMILHINAALACDKEFFQDGQRLGQELHTCDRVQRIADFYGEEGFYGPSVDLSRVVTATRARELGKDHPTTLDRLDGLALALQNQGKYDEAEEIHRDVAEAQKRVLGKEHPETLASLSHLALALDNRGKYAEAEEISREVIELKKGLLGNEHRDTLMSLNNLAMTLHEQGRYAEAEEMMWEVVKTRERLLGKEHLLTLLCKSNLAAVLERQGMYDDAEEMGRGIIASRERLLGKEHPDTVMSLNNLAVVLHNLGRDAEAEGISRDVVEITERTIGKEHPLTLTYLDTLGLVISSQGQTVEAEQIYRRTLSTRERVLGKTHPDTVSELHNLAYVLRGQGRYAEAESLQRRAVDTALAVGHRSTEFFLDKLQEIWELQGHSEDEIEAWTTEIFEKKNEGGT